MSNIKNLAWSTKVKLRKVRKIEIGHGILETEERNIIS